MIDAYPLLDITRVSKQIGKQRAIRDLSLTVGPGEVLGVADRSGTTKSVLLQLLEGAIPPDAGTITFGGRRLTWPFRPRQLEIGIVYDTSSLVRQLDVTSNIFLGQEIGWRPIKWLHIPNRNRMDQEARLLLSRLGAQISSVRDKVAALSDEQAQLVAIAQLLVRPLKLVVIDNADTVLSYPYQLVLLRLIREWQRQGVAVMFSSRNIDHLFAVCDRISVLRQDFLVKTVRVDETTREQVVAAMVGSAAQQERTPMIWALDSYYRARKQAETLRHNQMLLRRDLAAQDSLNRQLLEQLDDQVNALDSANRALQDAQRRLLTEREEERKHLARELHDQMLQDLLSLNYQLEEIRDKVEEEQELVSDLADVRVNIGNLVEELRRICGDLRPPTIDSLGLQAAIKSLAHQWSQRTGIDVELTFDASFGRLPETIELSLFRIIQESLNNIWKHAGAQRAIIRLEHTSPRMLLLTVADDGHGLAGEFDLSSLSGEGHYGLLGISERVALMGGRFRIQNQVAGGALLQVEVPHPRVLPAG